jgi:8-amino-7-oxononanoate synthase
MNLEHWMQETLLNRESNGSLRTLIQTQNKIDFVSNDYLGLAQSQELHQLIETRYQKIKNPTNGSTGSRLLAGNSELAEEVEEQLATIFQSEQTLLFNSGYTANLAALSCLPQKGDTILYDELVHACMHDGARLSRADRFSFKHNDLADLENKLKGISKNSIPISSGEGAGDEVLKEKVFRDATKNKNFIAVESVYSMDGDQCPLTGLVNLAEQYQAHIILDEAHSTGAYGKNGAGLAVSLGLESKIAVRIYTFGKAMGVHGACVAGSKTLINYLINFARPFIFSTAMSPHSLVSIQCAFEFLQKEIHCQQTLQSKINFFLNEYKKTSLPKIDSTSSIQSILVKGNTEVKAFASYLQQQNLDCRAIRSPSVKAGSERIRVCLHSFNTETEIQKLISALIEYK